MKIFTQTFKIFTLATALLGMSAGVMGQILSEDFTGLSGNNTSTSGSSTAWNGNENFTTVAIAYQAGSAVRIGSGSNKGSITTKSLDLSSNHGGIKVVFDVKGWTTVEGSIIVSIVGGAQETVTYATVMSSTSFETKEVTFATGGTTATQIKFETTAKRAFLDNIKIYSYSSSTPAISSPSTHGFATIVANTSATENINIKGANLTSDITIAGLTAPFSTTVTTITKEQAMTEAGFDIPVTFAPTSKGEFNTKLTITCADLTTPLEVNISAIAFAVEEVANITELRTKWTGTVDPTTYYKITGESLVSFANGKNYYMQDNQSGLLVYDVNTLISPALAINDGVKGITGKLELYNNMLELIVNEPTAEIITNNNTITPVTVAAADFIANFSQYEGRLVKIANVEFALADGIKTFKNDVDPSKNAESLNVTSEGTSFVVRTFASSDYAGKIIPTTSSVTGLAVLYNTTKQLSPRFKADIASLSTAIETPTLAEGSVFVSNGQIVVKAETAGALIEVYNIGGQRLVSQVAEAGRNPITLAKGQIYVVKVGNLVKKVVL